MTRLLFLQPPTVLTLFCAASLLQPNIPVVAAPKGLAKNAVKTKSQNRFPRVAPTNPILTRITDPVENSFSVGLPKGWRNQAFLARFATQVRPVTTSLSPDGNTLIFTGDPRLPMFSPPDFSSDFAAQWQQTEARMNPLKQIREFDSAPKFFTEYARRKFGRLPGFKIQRVGDNPALLARLEKNAQKFRAQGHQMGVEAARIAFSYRDGNRTLNAILHGSVLGSPQLWVPSVSGISTTGNASNYEPLLFRITDSHRTDPQWQAKENRQHEARMAQMRQNHQAQLGRWSAANQSHALRMGAIQDAGNASMKNWYEKQAASDASHRSFLNVITEENTVVAGGKSFQVDNSHQRYFVNKNNNTFIGTGSTTSLDDLRKLGVNPSDYREAKIKR